MLFSIHFSVVLLIYAQIIKATYDKIIIHITHARKELKHFSVSSEMRARGPFPTAPKTLLESVASTLDKRNREKAWESEREESNDLCLKMT